MKGSGVEISRNKLQIKAFVYANCSFGSVTLRVGTGCSRNGGKGDSLHRTFQCDSYLSISVGKLLMIGISTFSVILAKKWF